MKKATALLLALALLLGLSACRDEAAPDGATPLLSGTPGATRDELRMMYGSEVETFHYLRSGDTTDLQMSANLVDCLVEYDAYGVMQPALAQTWSSNDDATEWTFHIRQGVKWVDADGNTVADVTAHDWVSAAAYVLDAANQCANQYMYNGIVRNAAAYYEQTAVVNAADSAVRSGAYDDAAAYYAANGIDPVDLTLTLDDVGVQATDDLTLVYTMENPCPYFPSVLSYSTYMPVYGPYLDELGARFGADNRSILYNGAFLMPDFEAQSRRMLVKNPTYWDAEHVYIAQMEWLYNPSVATVAADFFLRDVIDDAVLSDEALDAWMNDPAKRALLSPGRVTVDYAYFYTLNFEPRFDAAYEPDNWARAVNNENFRQALYAGLDRVNALAAYDPYNPAGAVSNTITPAGFASGGGKDYTGYDPLLPYTDGNSFDEARALNCRDLARDELTAAGCTFPIKVLMPFNPAVPNWDKECRAVEEQLEALLGNDFIDIVVQAGPVDGFLNAVRRAGAFALMKCNWGADYADPQTWTEPMRNTNTYNFMYTDANTLLGGAPLTGKSDDTQALVTRYYELVAAAKAITDDTGERYEAFAKAEAYLLDHALVIPFSVSNEGYRATRLNVFEGQYAPYGLARHRFKFMHVYDTPISTEQFEKAHATWQVERAVALAAVRETTRVAEHD